MEGSIRGLPLLSGPAPCLEDPHRAGCRKCGKEFGLFTRAKTCGHCGFSYCSSCADHQALMPRPGPESGYQAVQVCGYCIEFLTVTASGRGQLRAMSVAKLRKYCSVYGIQVPNVLEKDDIVEAIINTREPNGCLPREKEDYYRRHSVPNKDPPIRRRTRDIFGRSSTPSTAVPPPTPPRARPPPGVNRPQPQPQRPNQSYPPHQQAYRQQAFPQQAHPQQPVPPPNRPSSAPPHPAPQPATLSIPSLQSLMELSPEQISALSIGTLKGVLSQNHVNARLILEKEDLVARVRTLIEAEHREREIEARYHAMEEEERNAARQPPPSTAQPQSEQSQNLSHEEVPIDTVAKSSEVQEPDTQDTTTPMDVDHSQDDQSHSEDVHGQSQDTPDNAIPAPTISDSASGLLRPSTSLPSMSPFKASASVTSLPLERDGLCVVCQDESANVAIVDCGHLALCMACSDTIMKTTRECPLCRTRIVTEQRLLRIFRS